MQATIDQWINREGMYQCMYWHDDNNKRITVQACTEDYARLCRLMSIDTIEIYVNTREAPPKSGFTLSKAEEIAWDILTTLAEDRQGKRGRAYVPTILLRNSETGEIHKHMGKGATI